MYALAYKYSIPESSLCHKVGMRMKQDKIAMPFIWGRK